MTAPPIPPGAAFRSGTIQPTTEVDLAWLHEKDETNTGRGS
jgi:hypothetical protein